MHFTAIADTDIGISRDTNQDSLLLKHAECHLGEVLLAVVCDGMGGLSKGEVASAAAVRAFSSWFDNELPFELEKQDMQNIGNRWSQMLKELNRKILEYSSDKNLSMGTTFTGILFVGNQFVIVHVGDCRVYHIASSLRQLTTDQTFVAREVSRGNMTPGQAALDKRRNMLLQCIGASDQIEPEVITGYGDKGTYILCSDGFRHEITEAEIYEKLNPANLPDKRKMYANVKYLVKQVKARQEKDNISVILIKAD